MSGRRAKRQRREVKRDGTGTRQSRSIRRRSRSPGRAKPVLFLALVVTVLAAAGYFLTSAIAGPDLPAPSVDVIDIAADMAGFDRPVIRIPAGEAVTVRLTSLDNQYHIDGGGRHQFAVDELGVNIIAPSLGSASATFTASKPGTYVFYCDICCGGRANPTMSGTLIVEA